MTPHSAVVELRRYTLHPGRRDELIALFEAEFVQSQEALGIELIGQFRDADAPDQFVWLRGYADWADRRPALTAFYSGPVWRAHAAAANATMIDSDDVFLLRPAGPATGFAPGERYGAILAAVVPVERPDEAAAYAVGKVPDPLAVLVTEPAENDYPALPVRTGEPVLVFCTGHADPAALDAALPALRETALGVPGRTGEPHLARLLPTDRSRLGGRRS